MQTIQHSPFSVNSKAVCEIWELVIKFLIIINAVTHRQ